MNYNAQDDIRLCRKHKLTPAMLLAMKILSLPDRINLLKACLELENEVTNKKGKKGGLTEEEIKYLLEKKLIISTKKKPSSLDEYEVNPKIARDFEEPLVNKYNQLFEVYPAFFEIAGQRYNGKTNSSEKLEEDYNNLVSLEEHELIIEDVIWGKSNNEITCSIEKFIQSKHWLALRELKEKDTPSSSNIRLL